MEIGKEYVVPLNKKEMKIYDRTKNRRIKKKQIKKAPIIEVRNMLNQILKNIKKGKYRNKY